MAAATLFPIKKLVALTAEMAERINAFRFDSRVKSESEAIRRLIELGLDAAKAKKPPRR